MPSAVNRIDPARVDDLRTRLAFWLRNDAARLLWPSRCLVCGDRGGDGIDLCEGCLTALPWNIGACLRCAMPLPLAAADPGPDPVALCGPCLRAGTRRRGRASALAEVHASCRYAAPVDRLLLRFKFHRDLGAGALLAQLMAQSLAGRPRPDAVLAVPLHRARLRARGYDQALELARPLARALGLPLLDGVLRRVQATTAQSRLDAVQRRRNLEGAFVVRPGVALPAHVALVDDVMTTGATLQAAALALQRAGVARVDAWVCARVA
jgi:ComF family protein